jgi:PAS domain S-box-containing protein
MTDMPGARPASSDERFRIVVEASPSGLVLVNAQGRIEMVNLQSERMFGHDRAALMGQPLEMLMPERFRAGHPGLRRHFMGETGSRAMGQGRDLFALRSDGSEFPIEIGLNPVAWDGEMMVLAAILDITERKASELELLRQRRELERSNRDLEEFAYVASHDLKAPLRAVAHLAEWIAEDMGESAGEETRENLSLLRQRVARLQMLLDGLLAYSRVGRVEQSVEPVDSAALVEDIVASLAPPAGFRVACAGPMPVLRTNRAPLEHVLQNLIANALKHHDCAAGEVTISARQRGGLAEFRVTDDGPGIPPQYHERIFVIFQTLASRDEVEAGGIGLAIVKKTVERHGGRVAVHSNPPQRGTSFVFTWQETVS